MATPNELNLLNAVIEFAKDPTKYESNFQQIKQQVDMYQNLLSQYEQFKNASDFLADGQAKLDKRKQELDALEEELLSRKAQLETDEDSFENTKSILINECNQKMIAADEKHVSAMQRHAELDIRQKRLEEQVTAVGNKEQQLVEKQAKLDSKVNALTAIINS